MIYSTTSLGDFLNFCFVFGFVPRPSSRASQLSLRHSQLPPEALFFKVRLLQGRCPITIKLTKSFRKLVGQREPLTM